MTEAINKKPAKERYKLVILVALELVGSFATLLLLRNNVKTLLLSWFLFGIFLSVMLLRGSALARIILLVAHAVGALVVGAM